ncbi:MAG: Integral membrane protein, partial [uncultured Friedmanniella sp.]
DDARSTRRPDRARPGGAASRRAAGPAPAAALPRAGALRLLDGHDGALRPRAGTLGRPARGPHPVAAVELRHGDHRRRRRGAADVDPAAPTARTGHGLQRPGHRPQRGRRAGPAQHSDLAAAQGHAAGARRGWQRPGRCGLHRQPVRRGPTGRADDGPGPAYRRQPSAGPDGHRGHGPGSGLPARRHGWPGHGALRRRDRAPHPALPALRGRPAGAPDGTPGHTGAQRDGDAAYRL